MQTKQLDSIASKTNQKGKTKGRRLFYRFVEIKTVYFHSNLQGKNCFYKKEVPPINMDYFLKSYGWLISRVLLGQFEAEVLNRSPYTVLKHARE